MHLNLYKQSIILFFFYNSILLKLLTENKLLPNYLLINNLLYTYYLIIIDVERTLHFFILKLWILNRYFNSYQIVIKYCFIIHKLLFINLKKTRNLNIIIRSFIYYY